jgi:valyl-tRNA synthetase
LTSQVPEKPALEGLEAKWGSEWQTRATYRFDRDKATRDSIYSIDTPPPTASGSLHIGHVFSYTHTDVVARYQRMRGKTVFYPMGWDDNGLPTERRVQNYYGVRCDPSLPYDPDFAPPFEGGDNKSSKAADQLPISRRNFIELCERLTVEDEKAFEKLWRDLGLSVDWSQSYRTIGDESQVASQRAFLRNLARGEAPRPSSRTASSRARTTASPSTRPTAPTCSSRPPGPSSCRPASRWWRTPTTSGTRRSSARP